MIVCFTDQRVAASDNLDLANSSIVNVVDITANGNLAVAGNVSIAGTLTYEDVENIDSVGLITARTGIKIGLLLVLVAHFLLMAVI